MLIGACTDSGLVLEIDGWTVVKYNERSLSVLRQALSVRNSVPQYQHQQAHQQMMAVRGARQRKSVDIFTYESKPPLRKPKRVRSTNFDTIFGTISHGSQLYATPTRAV